MALPQGASLRGQKPIIPWLPTEKRVSLHATVTFQSAEGTLMCRIFIVVVLGALALSVNGSSAEDKRTQRDEGKSKVIKESVRGGIAFPPEKRQWTRISGKVKVLNAHTLLFEDGTKVDLNGAIDAPELEQKGLI